LPGGALGATGRLPAGLILFGLVEIGFVWLRRAATRWEEARALVRVSLVGVDLSRR
jgi:hypothetical protein